MENAIDGVEWGEWPEPPDWLDGDDDPSGGVDDELTSEELSAMYDGSADGPDPELCPQAYPELRSGGISVKMAGMVLDAAGAAADLDDADLVESMAGWRAVASRATARELRATAELLRRRPTGQWDHRGNDQDPFAAVAPVRVGKAAVQELALGLTLTSYSAEVQANLADSLHWRLPRTFEAMDAGLIDRTKAAIINEATSLLDDDTAREADAAIAWQAARMTTGELRDKLRALVIRIDPDAAEKRRKRAERRARVRLYGNPDHTATLAAENLPTAPAVAAFARVAAVAAAMKASGMKGGIDLLRSRALIGLLLGNLPEIPPADPAGPAGPPDEPAGPDGSTGPDGSAGPPDPPPPPPDPPAASDSEELPDPPAAEPADTGELYGWDRDPLDVDDTYERDGAEVPWPPVPSAADAASPGCANLPPGFRPQASRMTLTIAWRTLTGMGREPGQLCWIGPVTTSQAARVAAAAAIDPTARWNLIVTDDDGLALTIVPLRTPAPERQAAPGLAGSVTITMPASLAENIDGGQAAANLAARALDRVGAGDVPGAPELAELLASVIPAARNALADIGATTGGCSHVDAVTGYVVPARLRRWVATRDRTCRNPTCRRPASRADQDHTRAYGKGGQTCSCNLGSVCRLHHQLKQLPGWTLLQTRPGYFTWITPAGLTYDQSPDPYPV